VETSTDDALAPLPPDPNAPTLADVRQLMRLRPPGEESSLPGIPRAAVALVLRAGASGVELLLIKRAERDDDPWSGHVALPGGRESSEDRSLQDTAIRETREETGIDLVQTGEMLGALDDLAPRSSPRAIVVRPFVAILRRDAPLVLSDEVAAAFWVPLASLLASDAVTVSMVRVGGVERQVSSFLHGDYVVWGMTERILRQLLSALAVPSFRYRQGEG
jgi:8-oxo-dGTP pyrophosphatase MutT (NUDIX family)